MDYAKCTKNNSLCFLKLIMFHSVLQSCYISERYFITKLRLQYFIDNILLHENQLRYNLTIFFGYFDFGCIIYLLKSYKIIWHFSQAKRKKYQ